MQCEDCLYYEFDEDFEDYICSADMDEDEYAQHSAEMHYPEEIDGILKKYMAEILRMKAEQEPPFNDEYNESLFRKYLGKVAK